MFSTSSFKIDHLYNIRKLKQPKKLEKKLLKNFLKNVLQLCEYVFNEGLLVLPYNVLPEGSIYRVGNFPIQFDAKYWPVGFGNDDDNELLFNSTDFTKKYIDSELIGSKLFVMCRQFTPTNDDIFLLNFKNETNELNTQLVYLLNKCIIIPIIYLNSTFQSLDVGENIDDEDALNEFLAGCTYDDIIEDKPMRNGKHIMDQLLMIQNIPGYDDPSIPFNMNYLQRMTVRQLLQSWNHTTGTRYSFYNTDRLYVHYLGSVLDLIEQYMNIITQSIKEFKIIGAYFPEIPDYETGIFDAEVLLRKKIVLTPSIRNEIFLKKNFLEKNCNASFEIKLIKGIKKPVLIKRYPIKSIFEVSPRRQSKKVTGGKLRVSSERFIIINKTRLPTKHLLKTTSIKKPSTTSLEFVDKEMLKNIHIKQLLKFYLGID